MNGLLSNGATAGYRSLLLLSFALACALLAAGGCSAFPFFGGGESIPTVDVKIEGQPDMNSGGNAAVVRIYELAGNSNFENTPLSSFWRDDTEALGGELINSREVQLFPGGSESVNLKLGGKTQFVGVAADLRKPAREGWRKLYPVSAVAGKRMNVSVATDQIVLDVNETE